jgi:hypothetical protein
VLEIMIKSFTGNKFGKCRLEKAFGKSGGQVVLEGAAL